MGAGWADQIVPAEQLYDLTLDPNEMRNLAERAHPREAPSGVRGRLREWMEETDDPLLEGPVPVPPGAVINDPSQTSPNDPLHTGTTL